MMKKILALVLCLALSVSLFAGCGGGGGNEETKGTLPDVVEGEKLAADAFAGTTLKVAVLRKAEDASTDHNEKEGIKMVTEATGINVEWTKVSVFVVTGLLVGVASFVQASKIGNVTPASSGTSYEMYAIAAVVLGGVNMAGGRGKILGVFFGALSYATVDAIIASTKLSPDIRNAFQGLVLIVVILIQTAGPVIKEKFISIRKKFAKK